MYMWRERSKEEKHEDVVNTGLLPLDVVEGFKIRPGFFRMYGACVASNGVSFTINSHGATRCTLLLFKPQAPKPYARIPFPDSYRIGDTYSMLVYDIKPDEFEYAFSFDGPYEPAKGLLFNEENVLLDPYSRAVTGQRKWGEKPEGGKDFEYRARVVKSSFDWGNIKQLEQPFEDLVIYEIHVRGYTKDKSSGVSAPGTFAGLKDKIPYLKDLGINAVELMPIFEFDEMESARVVDGVQLYNYWGYNTVSFFAPNTSYAFNEEHNHEGDELKSLIKALKENGIEVILDVVFNHTAEGNEMGPCFSFKGIDNNVYYMLTPDAHYYNFSGCGNVMNCNHPVVRNFIIDCLRHWAIEYRVDGFRFDLASILGRDQNGAPMANPPILESLAFDPVLGKMKLIAEAWDAGGLYQVGSFPSWNRWAEWNGRYRDDMRSFLFISFLLLLWCGFSSFESTSVRPNGWYYVIDMEHDSLSADPIVTVKDFARIKLDSVSDSNEDNMAYRILGVLDDSHKTTWADATEKSIGKHIGFLFNGVILTAPYVNCKIESGKFFIATDKAYDMKLLYQQILQEAGCKSEFGFTDEVGQGESTFTFWLIRGGLIGLLLVIMCFGFLKVRKIKKTVSG